GALLRPLSAAPGAQGADRRHALRRRAADARDRARPHVRRQAARHRRALARPRAEDPRGALRGDRQDPRGRRAGAARRAGGRAGLPHGLAQLRALAGPHHRGGSGRAPDERRDAARRLPGSLVLKHHGRYRYSAIGARPDYRWPQDKRLALYIGYNLEHFSFGEGLGAKLGPASPEPDVLNYSWRDYG